MRHGIVGLFLLIAVTLHAGTMPPPPGGGGSMIGVFMGCGAIAGKIAKTDANGITQCSDDAGAGTGAPTDAPYVTTVPNGTLTNEFALGSLATGLLINTITTGIPTIYAGASCTNQFPRALSASGALTCQSVATTDLGFDPATQAELDAHVNDSSAAHAASAIGFAPAGGIAATDVQAAIVEALTDAAALVTAHETDATAAHAATAMSFTPDGSIAATTVQAAVVEVRNETPRVGGTSPCAEAELFKTASGLWACASDASGGAGGTPGGAMTQVQFHDTGATFGGDAGMTYNKTTDVLTLAGGLVAPTFTGLASSATALATNGGNCSPGQAPLGVDTLGAVEGCFDVSTQLEFDAHLNDPTDAHAASAIGFTPTGTIAATTVQTAVAEVASEAGSTLAAHEADTTAVHGIADTSVLALVTDPRFPTGGEKAALVGTSGTAPSGANKYVDNADNRLASVQTPAALSASSQINADKPTQIMTGSGGPVTLTNPKWLTDGDFPGQTVALFNPSATNTVTGPTTATIINCGGAGSVVIGLNQETPKYTWTGTLWQLGGCINLQHVTNAGAKVIGGLTTAAPLQLRGGTADTPSTTGFDVYDDGAGNPVLQGISAGAAADQINRLAAGKIYEVRNSVDAPKLTVTETTGVMTNASIDAEGTGNTLTIPEYWDLDLVSVAGGVASHVWDDDPLSTACTPATVTGTNRITGVCTFSDTDTTFGRAITRHLPDGWTGALDAIIWWSTAGTGNARFQFQTKCYADDEVDDAAFNTASIFTAAAGTANRPNRQTVTGINTTGCAAGELMRIRFFRVRTEASDTLNNALTVEKVIFKLRIAH
jgi:hypothetical protein